MIRIYNFKSVWRPLTVAENLLETSKWQPNFLFNNIMISLFLLPSLFILLKSLLTMIAS